MSENQPIRQRLLLKGISSRAWEHPADRGALVALRRLQGFDTLIRKLSGFLNERMVKMQLLGSCVRVTERQFAQVHRLYSEAATTLDAQSLPSLYVQADPTYNATTIGIDSPKIVLNSSLLDLLDDDELRFVLGHELGHALSGHALYRTLLTYMDLDRSFCQAQLSADALVWQTQHHESKDAALAFTQPQMAPVPVFTVWLCRSGMAARIYRRLDTQPLGYIRFGDTEMVLELWTNHCGM